MSVQLALHGQGFMTLCKASHLNGSATSRYTTSPSLSLVILGRMFDQHPQDVLTTLVPRGILAVANLLDALRLHLQFIQYV